MSPAAPRMKMSEHELSFHIQEEILKRLPVKSLVQFRSVSKAWKSLIDSSQFIAAHSLTQPHHLLVSFESWMDDQTHYVFYVDDDTFPQHRSFPTLPLSVKELKNPIVVGSSRGLLCLFRYNSEMFVLWNPSIRKSISVVAASKLSFAGFAVCPVTSDPKIVSVTRYRDNQNNEYSFRCKCMVYTLSSGKWRSLTTNFPTKPFQDWCLMAVVTDRFIYWCARTITHKMIMSFDVTNESFEVIDLPHSLAGHDDKVLYLSKLRDLLAIIQSQGNTCTIWMMEDGVQRLFTKLFAIKTPCDFVAGFMKNGIPIMHVTDGDRYYNDSVPTPPKLVVYEPNSEHDNVIETCPSLGVISVNSYVETLLLLGRSDCDSYRHNSRTKIIAILQLGGLEQAFLLVMV